MCGYWFKPEIDKLLLLTDETVVNRWKNNSKYWGGALTAVTVGMFSSKLDVIFSAKKLMIYLSATFAI